MTQAYSNNLALSLTAARDRVVIAETLLNYLCQPSGDFIDATIWRLDTRSTPRIAGLWAACTQGYTKCLDDGLGAPEKSVPIDIAVPNWAFSVSAGVAPVATSGSSSFIALYDSGVLRWFVSGKLKDNRKRPGSKSLLAAEIAANCLSNLDYAEMDMLTGLLNRKTFDGHIMRMLERMRENSRQREMSENVMNMGSIEKRKEIQLDESQDDSVCAWIGVADLDKFKLVNDNYGHGVGDEILEIAAEVMKSSFRARDRLFRIGGEEFVAVLQPTNANGAAICFERFRLAMAQREMPKIGNITVSVGYAKIPMRALPTVPMDRADKALYWVKANGRDAIASYEDLVAFGRLAPDQQKI